MVFLKKLNKLGHLIFVIFLFAWANTVFSHGAFEENKNKELTIAINKMSYPYHFINEQGQPAGLMVDFWRLWAQKQHVKVKFIALSWQETLEQVKSGKVDIHAGLSILDSRRKNFIFSKSLFPLYSHVFINKKLEFIESVDDLKPYVVGVVADSAHVEMLNSINPNVVQKLYSSRHAMYEGALNQEVMVFTGLEKLSTEFKDFKKLNEQFPAYKRLQYKQDPYGVAVAKNNTALMNFITEGINKISHAEKLDIETKWFVIEKDKTQILVAFEPNFPPFMELSVTGEAKGLFIDVWRLWSKKTGRDIDFVASSQINALALLKNKKVDVLLAHPDKNVKADEFINVQTMYQYDAHIYVHESIEDVITLDDLNNETVAILAQAPFLDDVLQSYPLLKIRTFDNIEQIIAEIKLGRVKSILASTDLIQLKLARSKVDTQFYRLDLPVFKGQLSTFVHSKNTLLSQVIVEGFNSIAPAEFIDLESRWLDQWGSHFFQISQHKVKLTELENQLIANNKTIKVGIVEGMKPVEFLDSGGNVNGLNKNILDTVSSRTGLVFQYSSFKSWESLYQALLSGDIDLLGSITPTAQREKMLVFTESYWSFPWVALYPQYLGEKITLNDLKGKKIAIVKGYQIIEKIKKNNPRVNLVLMDNIQDCFSALQQGNVDGLIETIATASELMKKESMLTLKMSVLDDLHANDSHFALRKEFSEVRDLINKGLVSISEYEKERISNRWFTVLISSGLDKNVVLRITAQVSVIILIIIVVIIWWNRRLQIEVNRREVLESKMKHMAMHDELTGLANRVLLKDRLANGIALHQRQKQIMAVLFIDLDGFKSINDSFGHDVGDELLKEVALRLSDSVRESDTVVRFGGDEFVLLLGGLHSANEAIYVAEKVLISLRKQFYLSAGKAEIGCSIGIALYPNDGDTASELIKVADTLMYQVKQNGKNHYLLS